MPDRPLLILPSPAGPAGRRRKWGRAPRYGLPSRERQSKRLGPRFARLEKAIAARRAELRGNPEGVVPEEVLVLETVGGVGDFLTAVRHIKGMEWLGELEHEDIPPDDDFFPLDKAGARREGEPLSSRLFLVFSDQRALSALRSLWKRWKADKKLPWGKRKWREVFAHLRDIRPWGVRDRLLETGVLEDWALRMEHGEEYVPCEIELWFRKAPEARDKAQARVTRLIDEEDGRVLAGATISEIGYHALLAELPIRSAEAIRRQAHDHVHLVNCEQIQLFRACGQMATEPVEEVFTTKSRPDAGPGPDLEVPVVAVFDGMPLQNHRLLSGRLIVDDPDDYESEYRAAERRHGTAMCSLILHGDLRAHDAPMRRRVYVRPVLRPDPQDWSDRRIERVPSHVLSVDLIHRAVRRLFESEGDEPPAAPSVRIINLSIGVLDRPFEGALSPLARLLDWLSWEYGVLFLVSAGNHLAPITLEMGLERFEGLSALEYQAEVLAAIARDARHRRLLAPAEGVNVLTVASAHSDLTGDATPPRTRDPYATPGLPSPINAQGLGYRRAVKPDILAPGGRVAFRDPIAGSDRVELQVYGGTRAPGQEVAWPGPTEGRTSESCFTSGTSNAAALTTRAAAQLYELLETLRRDPGGEIIEQVPLAIWLKSLIVHSAAWGETFDVIADVLRTPRNRRSFREYVARFNGYGLIAPERVAECTAHRVTALGGGSLRAEQAHVHRFPLPPSLSGVRGDRRLILTLAWHSPVNCKHQAWRKAELWFEPPREPLAVNRQEVDWRAALRGTIQHEILKGDAASAFLDGDALEITVSCKESAGPLEDDVPYALAVTLEVADEVGVAIYEEVRVRIQAARVQVGPSQ